MNPKEFGKEKLKKKLFCDTVPRSFGGEISTNVNFNFGQSTIGEPSTNDLNTTDWDKPIEAEISTKFDMVNYLTIILNIKPKLIPRS